MIVVRLHQIHCVALTCTFAAGFIIEIAGGSREEIIGTGLCSLQRRTAESDNAELQARNHLYAPDKLGSSSQVWNLEATRISRADWLSMEMSRRSTLLRA